MFNAHRHSRTRREKETVFTAAFLFTFHHRCRGVLFFCSAANMVDEVIAAALATNCRTETGDCPMLSRLSEVFTAD